MNEKERPSLNPALRSFWTTRARNKVLYGGRASSKSWDAGGIAIFLANKYKLKFLCCRQIQNRIDESVYALLKIQIDRFGLRSRFRILENKIINIYTGSEFVFYGISRHVSEIKSIESVDILWLEEAHGLTPEQWEVLEPTIRKQGSECWFIFNPNLVTDFVYQNFVINPPKNTLVRKINYDENPFLSDTMLDIIADVKERDPEAYQHIYLGEPRTDDDQVVIKRSWILASVDAHIKLGIEPTGEKRIGFDIADSGDDLCAITSRHGILADHCEEWRASEDELLKSTKRVFYFARERKIRKIAYDCIGVGAATGSYISELNRNHDTSKRITHPKFNAGAAVIQPDKKYNGIKNKDFFANFKSQSWWLVADMFRNTYNAVTKGYDYNPDEIISISSKIPKNLLEKLITELSTPNRDFDNNGKVKVESKKDMLKRGIKSPNLADSFIIAFAPLKQTITYSEDWD